MNGKKWTKFANEWTIFDWACGGEVKIINANITSLNSKGAFINWVRKIIAYRVVWSKT